MRLFFHQDFYESRYATDRAAEPGRMEAIMKALTGLGHLQPETVYPVLREDVLLAHSEAHVKKIEENPVLAATAFLAAGGSVMAAESALIGEPAFACVRPPGHHASKSAHWGHCFLNNIAISLLKLKSESRIRSAFLLDFDTHTGDGTIDILETWKECTIINPFAESGWEYLRSIERKMETVEEADIIAVSAGFDGYIKDVGKKLLTEDFRQIGELVKKLSRRLGHERRFAVLEGGYYIPDLGENVLAFVQGMT